MKKAMGVMALMVLLSFVLLLGGCSAGKHTAPSVTPEVPEGPAADGGFEIGQLATDHREYQYAGQEVSRQYYYYIPSTYVAGKPMPLMLSLHGSGCSAKMQLREGGWEEFGEEHGIIIIAPESTAIDHNDQITSEGKGLMAIGRADAAYIRWAALPFDPSTRLGVDDVAYLSDLIDLFVERGYADPDRVYSSGLSNGALMSMRLAAELPDKIAGVGVVSGLVARQYTANDMTASRVKVVFIHGTEDPIVPIEGVGTANIPYLLSLEKSVEWLTDQYGLNPEPKQYTLPDTHPEDETIISCAEYADENGDVWVVTYTVEGGGHTWPGGTQYLSVLRAGRVSYDASATQLIWDALKDVHK